MMNSLFASGVLMGSIVLPMVCSVSYFWSLWERVGWEGEEGSVRRRRLGMIIQEGEEGSGVEGEE